MRNVFLYVVFPIILLLLGFYFWGQRGRASGQHQVVTYGTLVAQSQDTFSIMTYNLGYLSGMTNNLPLKPSKDLFESNLVKTKELIAKLQPDIIGFQEIDFGSARSYYMNQVDSLSDGFHTAVNSINWDKNYVPFPYWPPNVHFGRMLSGQAVLSKFPVANSERLVLSRPSAAPFYYRAFYLDRLVQVVELLISGQPVVILNVHLEAFDTETREIQAKELLKVVDRYAKIKPLILIGDFNARPPYAREIIHDEITITLFHEHPLLSSAFGSQEYLSNESAHFTFDTENPHEKLDYIFYTHQFIKPIEVTTIHHAGQISDHFPVLMTFSLLNQDVDTP